MTEDIKSGKSSHRLRTLLALVLAGITVIVLPCPGAGFSSTGQMRVIPDQDEPEDLRPPSIESGTTTPPGDEGGRSNDAPPKAPAASPEKRFESKVTALREELRSRYEPERQAEIGRMLQIVQVLSRDDAARWMKGFISSPPFNCPLQTRDAWIEAVISSAERNNLPICKEILALVASIVAIESGFRVDPPAVDRSRGEDMTSVLRRAEDDLFNKMGPVMAVPPVPQVYKIYREKYYPKLVACTTERDVEDVARSVVRDLKKDADSLPDFLKKIIFKEIDKIKNVVRTKGSMQLNFPRARQVMTERGERFTAEDLTDYMYTMEGGVDVGTAALKPMFVQYAARYAVPGDLSWLFFVGMDYHYGPFSSRNMMEQIRIRDLSGKKIALDGDFLRYDEKGEPLEKESETLQAAVSIFTSPPENMIFEAFLLEKDPHYIYTDLHKTIAKTHLERFGKTPFAVIGELWMGENAQIKHGTKWKTRAYLRKLDHHLNSVPWDQ
jgi:hypothetical protein